MAYPYAPASPAQQSPAYGGHGYGQHPQMAPSREQTGVPYGAPPQAAGNQLVRRAFVKQTEITLHDHSSGNRSDHGKYDDLADMYSLLVRIDHLEKAWVRGYVSDETYTEECYGLLRRHKTLYEAVKHHINDDLSQFAKDFRLFLGKAMIRVTDGVPATIINQKIEVNKDQEGIAIANAVSAFITLMDLLKIDMKRVDDIYSYFDGLIECLKKVPMLPPEHASRKKVTEWFMKVSKLKAHDELSESDIREINFELEKAYQAFFKWIQERQS